MTLPARIPVAGVAPARRNQRIRRIGALAGEIWGPQHGGSRADNRRYRSGEVVRQSGIYEVIHDREHREAHEVVMISGQQFPDCETCKEKVRFRLVRTAPYIFQDEDFEEES
jgi:hypothetical protein